MNAQATPQQLIEQARARYALQWLQESLRKEGLKGSELKSYTRRLPAMIRINGFGQAVAFYRARATKSAAYKAVYQLVEDWLCGKDQANPRPIYSQGQDLMTEITRCDQERYRLAQAETQALMQWAKKFVEAMIVEDDAHDS